MSGLLLDTSVVIQGIEGLEGTGAISVLTFGELRAGVLLAGDAQTRAARQSRLAALRREFAPLPVDTLGLIAMATYWQLPGASAASQRRANS